MTTDMKPKAVEHSSMEDFIAEVQVAGWKSPYKAGNFYGERIYSFNLAFYS